MRKDQGVVIDLDDNPVVARAKRYIVTVRGVGGLLQNKMPDLSVPKAEKKAQAKMDPIEKELATWREKIHTDDAGHCVIPGENLHECAKLAAPIRDKVIQDSQQAGNLFGLMRKALA